MIALIDVGNTYFKYVLVDADTKPSFDVGYTAVKHNDVNEQLLSTILKDATTVVYASVSNKVLLSTVTTYCQQNSIACIHVETSAEALGVKNAYTDFSKLGVDRWLALIAAKHYFPDQSCMIVDAGTATTIDIINSQGVHLGGWILPGLDTMVNALLQHTDKIEAEIEYPQQVAFGQNTQGCVNNGVVAATLGGIEKAYQKLDNQDTKLVITGGYGELLSSQLTIDSILEPMLVFKGLYQFKD
ncbi:type III pantothenate kinase [Thalassotalea agarivorans]|uniref:Type III pantothenate kinase n=1 Tax=Thalassotalea agarivorans TaxID=349064 RepID=A0A1I0I8D8_THASX|nr:type III pantothenate kinase [Thalassotalea agarivorans]SET92041.1 type III pantothenate kinase [Thalassotalea agarivorans]